MGKIRVRRETTQHLYPHNDLSNAAHRFKKKIDAQLAANDRRGIAHEILAELIFLAFAVEARLNFLGARLVANWNERDSFDKKMDRVNRRLGITWRPETRPHSTLVTLKSLRDTLAHGKPAHRAANEELIIDSGDDDDPFAELRHDWEKYWKDLFYSEAFEDVDTWSEELLVASGIPRFETMTQSEGSTKVLGHVPEDV